MGTVETVEILLVAFILGAAANESTTLTATPEKAGTLLTCHGSRSFNDVPSSRGDPVDIGVIINSAERTVSIAGYETYPISDMTDAEIDFGSDDIDKQQIIMRGMGTFDRLSGSLTFTSRFDGLVTQFDHFNLRCKPTQRLY